MCENDQDSGARGTIRPKSELLKIRNTERVSRASGAVLVLIAIVFAVAGCGVHFNPQPAVSLTPTTSSWHKVDVGSTSGVHTFTLTNTQTAANGIPLSISSITVSDNFIVTATTCPQSLTGGQSCTISVAFRPQTSGNLTGTLSVADNAMNSPQTASLSAIGGIGFLLFNPTSLSFPGVPAGSVSQPQTSTLTNEATFPVVIAKFTTSGKFQEGDNCPRYPNALQPNESCTVTVTSNPVAAGDITGSVNVEDNYGNVTQLYLSGSDQGLQYQGALSFNPAALLWGKVMVGSTSAPKTVTVTNTGIGGDVTFSNITTGPDFNITSSTCPATLAGGASCTISVAFRPTTTGSISELLTFTDNATGSPQAISLRGTGFLGDMLFTPTSLLFAGVDPGSVSPAQSATLTNETAGSISLASITVSGHFAQTNNCPASLGPGASCTFDVTANPVANGVITGSVNVKDNAGNSAQLYLQGQGGNTDKVLSFSPNPVVWGTIAVGGTSASKTLTVDNGQTVPLTIYSISLGPDFIETASTCPMAPTTVPAGSTCTISLAFRPLSAGAKSEVITFTDDAPGGNQSVSLRGTATAGDLLFNPTSLSFAGVAPNTVSSSQTSTLTNQSGAAVTLASITVSGHFAQTNNCGGSLGPGASCTFTVTSNPVIDGPISGAVNVKDGAGNITQLFLSGMGGIPVTGNEANNQFGISPTSLAFGNVQVGQTSGAQAITLSNGTANDVAISSITAGPDIYETANTCPVAPETLAGGASCSVSVAFRPQSTGAKSESLTFTDGGTGSPQVATITGTGTPGDLLFDPTSLTFASAAVGSASSRQSATLTNQTAGPITLKSIQAMGPFVQTNDCPTSPNTLAGGASCTVSASATPETVGQLSGSVDVTEGTGAVTSLYLYGTATDSGGGAALVAVSPTTLSWGKVAVGSTSGAKTVTVTNNQTGAMTISSITTGADFYISADTCPMTPSKLAGGASCTVSLEFRPTTTGAKSEPLTFTDNAADNPQMATLSGTGTAGTLMFSPGSLTFPSTAEYSTSASQTTTLTNGSTSAVTLSSITMSGAFAQTNNCPTGPLAGGASCTFTVTSKPTAVGAYSGSINVKDSSGDATQLYLSGNGAKPNTGSVTLSPAGKSFGSEYVGSTGTSVPFTLTNNGSTAVQILGIAISDPDFTQMNTCGSSVAGNASCTISVSFAPQGSGALSGMLTVTDDASNNPQSAKLSGTGMAAPVTLSPASLSWGKIQVGASSGPKTLTLTNATSVAVILDSITIGNDFVITANTCPAPMSPLAAGASCTVSAEFRPTAPGAMNETISFADNVANSPQTATLTGTGTQGSLMFSPANLTFAGVIVGNSGNAQTATLTNESGAALTLGTISVSGAFTQTNNCPTGSFAAGASCTFTVNSKPTATGTSSGAVNVHTTSGTVTELYLTGSGIQAPTGTATLSPSSNHFTSVASGKTGTPVPFTLTNNGSYPLSISSIATSNANFTETNTCGSSLAGNASCTIEVTFAPQSIGAQSATLTVTDNASNGPTQSASLTGTGVAAPSSTGSLKVSPSSYTFPNQTTGTTSKAEMFTVTNTLTTSIAISSIRIAAPFQQTNNCSTLTGGASCTVQVTYSPTAIGYSSADLTFTYNAAGSPQTVFVAGNSGAGVTVAPSSLGFSPQIINRPSSPQTITVTNNQTIPLTVTSITSSGSPTPSPFQITNTCIPQGQTTGTVAANSNCTISVTFDPTKITSYTGSVTIAFDAGGSPVTVPLQGQGIGTSTGVQVIVTPQYACVEPSGTEQYSADVTNTNNTAVSWYVDNTQSGTAANGKISTGGLYTAPSSTGTHTIKAVSQANTSASGSTTITVTTNLGFSIYPNTVSLPTGGQQTFEANICNTPDTNSLTYAVDGITGGNATVGTITAAGVYTAPGTAGKHTVKVTDSKVGKSSVASVTVYSGLTVDFGSRTVQKYPIAPGMMGANHVDGLHSPSDMNTLAATGLALSRTYALIPQVYATSTPDWTQIDPKIKNLQAAGMKVMLEVVYTPPWLQPNPNPCGAGNTSVMPTSVNAWAKVAASYVAHMDAMFPGVVTDYEIGNEPDAGGLCVQSESKQDAYLQLYAAAAPLMKQQAATDGQTIRVGGPALTSPNSTFITALLTDSSTAPYVDFVSYHNYMGGTQQTNQTWDSYNGTTPLYQVTQGSTGAAAYFLKAAGLLASGKQPLGTKTPIYITEYNTNWAEVPACCRNDAMFAPVWNAMYVSDLLDTVYSGAPTVPGKLAYFAASQYPYFCLLGTWDSAMDCQYSQGSTPAAYPQLYAYQLMGSSKYLGLNSGGYMAASVSPAANAGGLIMTAFYTTAQDSILIVNPTATDYSQITINIENAGLSSAQAVLYQIVNGNQITSSSLSLTPSGTGYTATIDVPSYTVLGIAIQGQ